MADGALWSWCRRGVHSVVTSVTAVRGGFLLAVRSPEGSGLPNVGPGVRVHGVRGACAGGDAVPDSDVVRADQDVLDEQLSTQRNAQMSRYRPPLPHTTQRTINTRNDDVGARRVNRSDTLGV